MLNMDILIFLKFDYRDASLRPRNQNSKNRESYHMKIVKIAKGIMIQNGRTNLLVMFIELHTFSTLYKIVSKFIIISSLMSMRQL